ncbi:MAG: TRAP transporter substrate-binding protein [Thermincolia bacterium]
MGRIMQKGFMVLALGGLLVLSGCGTTEEPKKEAESTKPTVELKLGHVTQAIHPYHLSADAFAKKAAEKSQGRIKITIFPTRQLGDDKQQLEAIIAGTQNMGLISASQFASYTPVLAGLQLPWLIDDYDTYDKVLHSEVTKKMLVTLEKNNLKGLAIYEGGIRDILTKDKKIIVPADLKGMKLRVPPSEVLKDWALAVGAIPVPLPYSEVYNALQTGMVDGVEMNPSSVYTEKFYEVAKYLLDTNQFPFPSVLIMNLQDWNKLSPEDQKILLEAATEAISDSIKFNKEEEEKALKFIKSNGLVVYSVDMAPWKEKAKPVYEKWMAKDPLIKELVEYVEKIKKEK